ncbi:MAG TPA: YafY family protein [Gaiellaceae bacterium]|nr:YafY family protein [Gaiellaceae bacterium]
MRGISRPASRLLGFLELLQARSVVDGPSAASELGVSERTIRRYAVALHELGIPVDGQPGVGGGYRLRAGARLPPLMLADEEAAATVFGLVLAEQRGLSGAQGALAKIARVLPARLARRVERLRDELRLSGEPEPPPASSETLLLIAEAVRRRRSLRIGYERRDGTWSTREIDPLGLVARRGRWYVPARDRNSSSLRTFRADRITSAAIGAPAEPPEPGFDPVAHVVQMLVRLPWGWQIEVQLDAPLEEIAARIPPTLAELTAEGSDTRLEMRADSLTWAAGLLAGLGAEFRVIRPDELREELTRLALRLERAVLARATPRSP